MDIKSFKKEKEYKSKKRLIFIGTLIYHANDDAIKYFLTQIYPKIKKEVPKAKLILVSWHKPKWLKKYLADKTISLIQDKETPSSQFLSQADIFIAPMRIASGTNIKVLEAMAAGLPVVTTSVGIEGIKATKGAIIHDDPRKLADETAKLLKDKDRRQQLGKAGREEVSKLYDWTAIGKKLDEVYQKQAQRST